MEIESEVVRVGEGSDFTECKICKVMMTRLGHEDGRCYECRRLLYYGEPLLKVLREVDESLRILAKRPSRAEEKGKKG